MRRDVVAVMPTVGASGFYRDVVRAVMNEVAEVIVPDNWPDDQLRPWSAPAGLVTQLHRYCRWPGVGLYTVWNRAFVLAQAYRPGAKVLFLNDDITVPEGLVGTMAEALDRNRSFGLVSVGRGDTLDECFNGGATSARPVSGTYRNGGVSGHCFMVAAEAWPDGGIDERFRIWFGDDDLVYRVREAGWKVGVLDGLVCGHPGQSGTVNAWPDRDKIIDNDRRLWKQTGRP